MFSTGFAVQGQTPAPVPAPPPPRPQRVGGFVPGQHREPGDPVEIARGKTIYGIQCAICHGPDLRGGDMGGPNLLRSQLALSDQHGELIVPVIQGSRQAQGMPAIPIKQPDALAVSAYVRSVMETIGVQGTPPPTSAQTNLKVIVGNPKEGQAYFAAKCASCHSTTGDLQGIATKFPEARDLQSTWVRGEARGAQPVNPESENRRAATASVQLASGEKIEGRLIHIDDFLVSLRLSDGGVRSFPRKGGQPKVEIHDPMKPHRDLLTQYTDRDIHDVTAFLATIK